MLHASLHWEPDPKQTINQTRIIHETLNILFARSLFFCSSLITHLSYIQSSFLSPVLAITTRPHGPNPRIIRRNARTPTRRNRQRPIHSLINIRLITILLSHIHIIDALASIQVRSRAPQRSLGRISAGTEREGVCNVPGAEVVGAANHVDVLAVVRRGVDVEDDFDLAGRRDVWSAGCGGGRVDTLG